MTRGKNLTDKHVKSLTLLSIILISMLTLSLTPYVNAKVNIISVAPSSGKVGTTVKLIGNITTNNGKYQVLFDKINVTSGKAEGNNVNASFLIPEAARGNHTITLIDLSTGENATTKFEVLTAFSLKTYTPKPPAQLQEGDSVTISLNVTGGEINKEYVAEISVQTPTNDTYSITRDLLPANDGSDFVNLTYPDDFKSVNPEANTNYTGEYIIYLNVTSENATFSIGLTDFLEYHRFSRVNIKAVGYKQDENVTITVSSEEKVINSTFVKAEKGIVNYTWMVPANASVGTYAVNITSTSNQTVKKPPDFQKFIVPGFNVNVTTTNLAGENVANIEVRAFEKGKPVENKTSDSEGIAHLKLEIGNYTCEAYFKNRMVGETSLNVTEAGTWKLICNLTNLKVIVVDKEGHFIPKVTLAVTPQNMSTLTLVTDINGLAVAHSLLPNITYTLNASRYNEKFNTTTIQKLPTIAWFNLTITCPLVQLQLNVTDVNDNPIDNAKIKLHGVIDGLYYEGRTVNGIASFNCTFGKYTVEVYVDGIKLKSTTINLLNYTKKYRVSVNCELYGLTVTVKIVDYFGQPIPNLNVTLQREGLPKISKPTRGDGTVTFNNVIGGETQITAYSGQKRFTAGFFNIEKNQIITLKVGEYVVLAGFLIETSQLAIAAIIIATIIIVVLLEIYYRKKRGKPKKGSEEG